MSQVSAPNSTAATENVFSSPQWDGDHNVITVTNDGSDPLTISAWVNSPDNNVTETVPAGATANVSTASVLTQPGQLVNVGYNAYDNGAQVDSYQATVKVTTTPTPLATTRSPGFTLIIALGCVLGAGLLITRKKGR
jgi:hypothetical protein